MRKLNTTGRPINRPLWWDFPEDRAAWGIDDEFMFGDSYLVAPVLTAGATARTVYLPTGASWTHHFTNTSYAGGSSYSIPAPLATFPLFHRHPAPAPAPAPAHGGVAEAVAAAVPGAT